MGNPTNTDDHLNVVEKLLLKQEQASSTSTRKHYLATLNTILQWAQKYQLLSTPPTPNIRRKRIVEHVSDALNSEKIDRLLEKLLTEGKKMLILK